MYPIMQRCRVALWDTVSDVVSSGCILGIFARLVHHPGNCHILQKNIFRVLHTTYYFYVTISIRAVCSMPFQKRPVSVCQCLSVSVCACVCLSVSVRMLIAHFTLSVILQEYTVHKRIPLQNLLTGPVVHSLGSSSV